MQHAVSNGLRLLEDARILRAGGRYPSATALALLAIEEFGKVSAIRAVFIAQNAEELRSSWRNFRSHKAKNVMWPASEMDWSKSEVLRNVFSLSNPKSPLPEFGDLVKQLSLYVDLLASGEWWVPERDVHVDLAEKFVASAEYLARICAADSKEELELYAEAIKRYPERTLASAEAMLVYHYEQLQEAGLRPLGPNPWEGLITGHARSQET
ncbi:MAG: AbiV family abortive infection protein [Dyella sp.]|uniref:AbiV family abortive infection protein n=1 Tax=Dyella sp. TaxID=1869338 RepID=UPI003F809E1D